MAASTIIGCQLGHESMVGVSYCNNSDFSTIAASCCGHNLTTSFLRSSASVFHGHRELNSNPLASNLSRLFSHKGVQLHKHVTTSMLIPKMQATKGGQVVCFGEMLIDFVPTVGGVSLAEAPAFKKAPGGAPANVAVGIAKLGGKSAFIGKVGQDEFGVMLVNMLNEHNVESKGVRLDPGARTALAFVTLRSDSEREFMFYRNPSADMLLQPTELDLDLIKQATIFHYGSISLIADPCRSAHELAMKTAKEAGNLLSYDPNLRLPLWPSAQEARQGIFSIWDQADVIKVSEEEITFLTEGGDPYSDEAARALWRPSLKLLLVTEGALGCRYYTKDFQGRVEGIKVEAVDTTGAGDAFVAGVLSQLVNDMTLFEDENKLRNVLRFANACGAITTTERGAIPALPTKEAVLEIVRNR